MSDSLRNADYTAVPSHLFCWKAATSRWEETAAHADAPTPLPGSMRVATLNVLHDHRPWHERAVLVSDKRFKALPAHVEALDADVVALHDVTKHCLALLLESEFVRSAGYAVSAVPESIGERPVSVLLSRLPVVGAYGIHLTRHHRDGALLPCFAIHGRPARPNGQSKQVVVGALRSTSNSIAHAGIGERAYQLKAATEAVRGVAGGPDAILLADTNFQQTCEDGSLAQADLLDVWAETHFADGDDGKPGYTHDPGCNGLLRQANPGERRQLRPDRILVPSGSSVSPCGPANLWATTPLPVTDVTAPPTLWSKVGLGHKTVDLFLSDRFGVVADVKVGDSAFVTNELVRERLESNARVPVRVPKATDSVDAAFAVAGHAAFFAARLAGQR